MPKPGQRRNPGPSGNELGRAVNEAERRSWPTPTRSDSLGGPGKSSSRQGGDNLRTAVAREPIFPTPIASNTKAEHKRSAGRPPRSYGTTGPLNPEWVEWLMGFPAGWTA
ncbi:MAG: hypothetical protein ACTHN7_06225, partial [Solirubrobacterales bacterium]